MSTTENKYFTYIITTHQDKHESLPYANITATSDEIPTTTPMVSSSDPPHKKVFSVKSPVRHVAFVKVHKAASTSIQNIFYRYGYNHDLAVVQPRGRTGLPWQREVTRDRFYPPPPGKAKFDIMCVYATYSRKAFDQLLPRDSVYVAIVREPFKQFASSLNYYHRLKVSAIPGPNPVRSFLENAQKSSMAKPTAFNTQSRDLGFPANLLSSSYDKVRFIDYLHQLDNEIDLVMVVERFDESLILMRRLLNWDLKDIVTGNLNSRAMPSRFHFSPTEEQIFKKIVHYDYALYDFFNKKLEENIAQAPDFHEELIYFRQLKRKYCSFCLMNQRNEKDVLWIEKSRWNEKFSVTNTDCELLFINERSFSLLLKAKMGHNEGISRS
ncbi:galactose-3-O-sulfotransferase 2-like [Argopecten irradians]|uniref:galactose-3-O-sulfotransferase 2-like n=1 Tax=Argopecten irradians TaxID=31199 RepID=UPI003716B874